MFLARKLIILIIIKITRIITTFMKFIILILFIKVKVEVDVKNLIYYNYN